MGLRQHTRLAWADLPPNVAEAFNDINAYLDDIRAAVELADTKTTAVEEKAGMVEVYGLRASDWNRVVAVARGHMSQGTRQSLDRFTRDRRPPEGTRLVLMSEDLALALGADRVEWGDPDEHGWYTPTLFRGHGAALATVKPEERE